MNVRHASRLEDSTDTLCGLINARKTEPTETINCRRCKAIRDHLRERYPEYAIYTDWRMSQQELKQVLAEMDKDLYGGKP